ncbi:MULTISPECIES: hypothetical protein [unclassified Lentimonas]|uniref:hypothetical protein n=1 Tax=unclassified Lentimonas TaxID=2630993 RepID=UPI0013232434|nr:MULTISPECIES: hypothetical protein [unclassified Lentimonas]CAA6697633.1 Unannotated [Lentimonas sp. CC10]CAA6697770.1 Unannotated [Lentimonas sp. CC19]CAA7072500.1 Unannotated [Lentimonas sp. CC11]
MKTKIILIFYALTLALAASPYEERKWSDQTGRSFTGTMLSINTDSISILRSIDSKEFKIRITTLSEDDQIYITSMRPVDPCKLSDAPVINLIDSGDIERSSSKWDFRNQKKAFRRVSSNLVKDFPEARELGERVLQVDRTKPDESHQDGPPYVTQIVKFKNKPEKVLVCFDALYTGSDEKVRRGIRLSATDPSVRYAHGSGNTFPFVYRYIKNLGEWHHFEWIAELNELDNDKISFGFMLTHEDERWFLDNISVTEINESQQVGIGQ